MQKLLSSLFLTMLSFSSIQGSEIDLKPYEFSHYSQNGEDGVICKIFEEISPRSKFCVEFGAYDGVTCSNTYLLRLQGWQALLLDNAYSIKEHNLFQEHLTAENINDVFEKYQVPFDLDFLSIDIDFNDFYIWQALSEKYKPAVVVIEYNATHLPTEDKVVVYDPYVYCDGSNYFGASILAFYNLGRSKGYSLVYAEEKGVNLFFVRDDILKEKNLKFKNVNDVFSLYRTPKYGTGPNGGHFADPQKREYISSVDLLKISSENNFID